MLQSILELTWQPGLYTAKNPTNKIPEKGKTLKVARARAAARPPSSGHLAAADNIHSKICFPSLSRCLSIYLSIYVSICICLYVFLYVYLASVASPTSLAPSPLLGLTGAPCVHPPLPRSPSRLAGRGHRTESEPDSEVPYKREQTAQEPAFGLVATKGGREGYVGGGQGPRRAHGGKSGTWPAFARGGGKAWARVGFGDGDGKAR